MIQLDDTLNKLSYLLREQCFDEAEQQAQSACDYIANLKQPKASDLETIAQILWVKTWLTQESNSELSDVVSKMSVHCDHHLGENHTLTRHLRICVSKLREERNKVGEEFVSCLMHDELHPDEKHLRLARTEVFNYLVAQKEYDRLIDILKKSFDDARKCRAMSACLDIKVKLRLVNAHRQLDRRQMELKKAERRSVVKIIVLRSALNGMSWRDIFTTTMSHHSITEHEIEAELEGMMYTE